MSSVSNEYVIKIAIADDHKIFRKGVILSLRQYTNIKFVLEAENGYTGRGENTAPSGSACTSDAVAEARGLLLREASRVSTATRRSLGEVINHAANGAFQFSGLSSLGDSDLPAIRAAIHNLQSTKQ